MLKAGSIAVKHLLTACITDNSTQAAMTNLALVFFVRVSQPGAATKPETMANQMHKQTEDRYETAAIVHTHRVAILRSFG
jgi:hypothetical protein